MTANVPRLILGISAEKGTFLLKNIWGCHRNRCQFNVFLCFLHSWNQNFKQIYVRTRSEYNFKSL